MGKVLKKLTALFLCIMMIVPFMSFTTSAEEGKFQEYIVEADGEPISLYRYLETKDIRAYPKKLNMYEHNNNIVIVDAKDEVVITTYTKNFSKLSEKKLPLELPLFGGFFSGETYNFIVFGQENPEEDLEKEVFRIVKYDKQFNRIDSCSILGNRCNTVTPFDGGTVSFAECNNELTIHTARVCFASDDGKNHQMQFTIVLDIESMTPTNNLPEIYKFDPYNFTKFQDNHVSHSFNQLVKYDNGKRVLVDHGDGAPRSIYLQKYEGKRCSSWTDNFSDKYQGVSLFKIPGESGANYTGVSIGGFQVSKNNYIVSFNSINHNDTEREIDTREAWLVICNKDFQSEKNIKTIQLTNYIENQKHASQPFLIKISEKRFVVLWEEYLITEKTSDNGYTYKRYVENGIKYVIIDESGNKLTEINETNLNARFDDCEPILVDNKVLWYYNTDDGKRHIYSLDLSDDLNNKLSHEHNIVEVPAKESTCNEQGNHKYYECDICGVCFEDAEQNNITTPQKQAITFLEHQGGTASCEKKAKCELCGEYYGDMPEHTPFKEEIDTAATCTADGQKHIECECGRTIEWVTIPATGHTPGTWETVKAAECEADGLEAVNCTVCGDEIESRIIPALGHNDSDFITVKEPTCSKEGSKYTVCLTCGRQSDPVAIPKTEHIVNSDAAWLNDTKPTCTEDGLKFRRCSVCKEPAEYQVVPALGHESGAWETISTPSCEGTGERIKKCTVCGEVSQREILNANGHKPADDWTVVTSATCTTDGVKVKKCTVCTLNVESEVIPALGHNPETSWEIIKEATCTEEGIRSCRCTRCIYSVTETIPAKGHALEDEWKTVTPATCTQSGTTARFCENCEYSLTRDIPATGHAVGEWEIIKKADCKNTGTKVKRCTNCNNIIQSEAIPVSGHTGGNWVITRTPENGSYGIKSKFCTGCGIKLEEKIIYSINSATVKDYSTGVEIIYAKETFDGNAAISARALSGSELSDRIYNKFGECIFKGYEAVLLNDGIPTVPANSYSLRLPVPEGFNRRNAEVYAVDMNTGELYAVSASYDNGYFLIDKVDAVQYVIVERIINISLSETSLSMKKGDSVQLYAETNGYGVTYTSSDPSVATVDIHGNVTAVGSGSAVITASVDGSDVKAECTVEVTQSFFEMIIDAFSNFFKMIAGLFGL